MRYRIPAALLFAGLLLLPTALVAAWGAWTNPWFLDDAASFFFLAVLPPLVVGGALGAAVGRGRGGGALLLVEALLIGAAWMRPKPGPVHPKLLVFGIDGATWNVADRLSLPALQGIQQRGSWTVLRSEEPMFSPLLWTTMATGEHPDQHGIRGFRTRSDQVRAARFWEVAADAGMAVGVYKWLVTWPPRSFASGGFVVPAWLAPTPETWPEEYRFIKELELARRLHRRKLANPRPAWRLALDGIPHGLRWSTLAQALVMQLSDAVHPLPPLARAWRLQLLRVWMDRDVFIAALHEREPAVATFTTYATDALGHTHWALMERCVPAMGGHLDADCPSYARAVPDAYRQADAVLGEILAHVGEDTTVIVVSDHGFRAAEQADAGRAFAPLTERLRARIAAEVGPVDVARLGHKVVVTLQAEDRDAERAALETWLGGLVQGSTGAPFYRWEDLPDGAVGLTLAVEEVDEDRLASDTVGGEPIARYVKLTERYTGEHDGAGIFAAAGPGVPARGEIPEAELVDVAPTLLALLGLPSGRDMPGRALFGERVPRVGSHDVLAHANQPGAAGEVGEDDVNTEALRAIGYIE